MKEAEAIRALFQQLVEQRSIKFPALRSPLDAPLTHGVYVIRNRYGAAVHVGRSIRGKQGLAQRLRNHMQGQSSFVISYLDGDGGALRGVYTYQYLEVADDRKRALLEYLAVGELCPEHLGVGQATRHPFTPVYNLLAQ